MIDGALSVYRACTPVIDIYVGGDESPAVAIVGAVAAAAGVDPTELPPLYQFINPDAIDDLFLGSEGDGEAMLCFQFENWNVFLDATGHLLVCDATVPTEEPEPVFS